LGDGRGATVAQRRRRSGAAAVKRRRNGAAQRSGGSGTAERRQWNGGAAQRSGAAAVERRRSGAAQRQSGAERSGAERGGAAAVERRRSGAAALVWGIAHLLEFSLVRVPLVCKAEHFEWGESRGQVPVGQSSSSNPKPRREPPNGALAPGGISVGHPTARSRRVRATAGTERSLFPVAPLGFSKLARL
jgi:hypothetical protein